MLKLRDLAVRSDFEAGPLRVSPSRRLVEGPRGRVHLEPLVMQVFLLLLDRDGEVVTRNELFDQCWGGAMVGDDSLNRAIAKVRRVTSSIAPGLFEVETIPRTGYRLTAAGVSASAAETPRISGQPSERRFSRRTIIGSAVSIGTIALAGGAVAFLSKDHAPLPLAKAYYDRGIATRGQGYSEAYEQAVGYFRQAVQIDPAYADAWGALAWSYRVLVATQERADSARLQALAQSAARRALELDADNADAELALLLLEPHYRRWAQVEQGCRRLLRVQPDHSLARFHLAYVLGETGRPGEAIRHMERVIEREPAWPMAKFRLFEQLSAAGRFEEADARIDEVARLAPRQGHFWASKINYLLLTGRGAEARILVADQAARPIDDDRTVEQERLIVEAYGKRSGEARTNAIERLLADAREQGAEAAYWAAINCAMLEELDTAFSLLEGLFFGRGAWMSNRTERPPTHPLFSLAAAPLRRDPRFARVLEQIGLEAFWRQTGTRPDFRAALPS